MGVAKELDMTEHVRKIDFFFFFSVLLVLGVQQSESVIHISPLFKVLFSYRPLQSRITCAVS